MNIKKILSINLLFIFVIILLTLIGTAALYSAAKGNFDPWAIKHIIRFGICLIMIMVIASIDLKIIYKFSYHIFIICLLLLISVEIVGTFGKGAARWIKIFGVTFQPSEIIKVSIILALAKFYHDIRFDKIGKIYNLIFPLLVILIPSIFIIFQPDLGTAITVLLLGSISFWKRLLSTIFWLVLSLIPNKKLILFSKKLSLNPFSFKRSSIN